MEAWEGRRCCLGGRQLLELKRRVGLHPDDLLLLWHLTELDLRNRRRDRVRGVVHPTLADLAQRNRTPAGRVLSGLTRLAAHGLLRVAELPARPRGHLERALTVGVNWAPLVALRREGREEWQ